ncbi:MAG: PQQ-binding-like beta-propeller repeat protein [Actinotalea sp.]|nr:PQQ-binding-like beta-propeller repeat protein [Actinotalea sp.]
MRRRPVGGGRPAGVEVVLVEDERAPRRAPAPEAAVPPAGARPELAGRRSRVRAAAVLALVGVLGVAGVLQTRHQAVVAAALERQPGLLRPLSAAPTERWALARVSVAGVGPRDVLVSTPDGRLHGVDPLVGEVRWSTEAAPAGGSSWCSVLHRTGDGAVVARAPRELAAAALVVCEQGRWVPGSLGSRVRVTTATTVDPATGAVLARRGLGGGLLVSDTVDGDLVHAWADLSGRVGVVRWDPWTGEERWTYRSDDRVTERRSNGVAVHHGAGTVTFVGSGTLTVDLATGSRVHRRGLGDGTAAERLPDGSVALRGADGTWTLIGADGARVALPGAPLLPTVGPDRAAPAPATPVPLLVRDGDRLVGVDPRGGEILWQVTAAAGRGVPGETRLLAQTSDTAVLATTERAWAVDLADGSERWRSPLLQLGRTEPLTDGTVVALAVPDGTGGGALVGVDLRSGDARWRLPLPAGTTGLRPAHGLVLVTSSDGVRAMG